MRGTGYMWGSAMGNLAGEGMSFAQILIVGVLAIFGLYLVLLGFGGDD